MLGLDRWQEIYETLRRNRLRASLTALSVAWGLFMLIVLLGTGRGLENSAVRRFGSRAIHSVWVFQGQTSLPYEGHGVGREIHLTNRDYDAIRAAVPGIDLMSAYLWLQGNYTIRYKDKRSAFSMRAAHPDYRFLEDMTIVAGRFVNQLDIVERRKVVVIGAEVARFLFADAAAVGKLITINDAIYRVVGVFEDQGGEREQRRVYMPISTAQAAYNLGDRVHLIAFAIKSQNRDETANIEGSIRRLLGKRHLFSRDDKRAVRVFNNIEYYSRLRDVFTGIRVFVWIVGAGTIIAGIVGVSNIMLISVAERSREFAVRKALGATPRSIIAMIVQEAIVLTSAAGYVGVVAGVAALELAVKVLPENDYLREPQVELSMVLLAVAVLTVFGVLAGFFPARRAAKLHPVVALRDE